MLFSGLRDALIADLRLEYPDFDVYSGVRSGKAVDRGKLCVFWNGFQEQGTRVVVGESRIIVRYWPVSARVADNAVDGVRDPQELEDAAENLATFLQTKQTSYTSTGAWFVRLVGVQPDYDPDEWGVEATLVVMFDNPAVVP